MPPEMAISERILRRVLMPAYFPAAGESARTRISNPYLVARIMPHKSMARPTATIRPNGMVRLPTCNAGQLAAAGRFFPCGNTFADGEVMSRQYDVLSKIR